MSLRGSGLEGPPERGGCEGVRMASSMSDGVPANDDAREGGYGKSEKFGSKFENLAQSESKVGNPSCERSS